MTSVTAARHRQPAQAQKHVTHNEALTLLDILVQLAVESRALTAPPSTPADNSRYIVKATGTGAFAGKDNQIAQYSGGSWSFYAPHTGWAAYVSDEGKLLAWNGSAWTSAGISSSDITSLQNLSLLGVGATADSTNPFSAKLNNALWAGKTTGEGGDGTLRLKLSKESAAKTLSVLFQDNFSGRAEIGLTGDDDFHFKVSADGSAWIDAIVVDKSSGAAKLNSGFFLAGDISPSQIASDQNDYNPAGLSASSVLRLSTDASRNITGLSGGGDGRIVAIVNAGTNNIVLKDANGSSSASNRFSFGADITLATKQSAVLWYDAIDSRWKLLAGPNSSGGSVSSVFGRTGAVVAATGDYSISQIANARDVLTANRTYYVRADGSDSNDGLANSAGGAFLTIQKAIDVAASLDLSIRDVTIQVGNGTYTGQVVCKSYAGAGKITILGDATTPSNVTISVTAPTDAAIMATSVRGIYAFKGVKIATVTSGHGIHTLGSVIEIDSVEFALAAGGYNHIYAEAFSRVKATGNYSIGGNAGAHIFARTSYVDTVGITVTLSGTPAFAYAYAYVESAGVYQSYSMTFSGSATGSRYTVNLNGAVYTAGAGANYFPGNAAGSAATGGQYA